MTGIDDAQRTYIRRGTITRVYDDGTQQLVDMDGLKSEKFEKVHRPQTFGISTNPTVGSEGIIAAFGGRSDRAFMLGAEHKDKRPKNLAPGHTALYDGHGNIISLIQSSIRVVAAVEFRVVSPKIVLESANVHLGGEGGLFVDRTDNNPSTKVKSL